ncbi:MAG: NCS1 family nucleobase:cation symporter-1 [Candidatus Sericytochromatia bacterium]|nr:NCS1 family nucleobase:cation symporter-1 [Candidatus Tanganyikabacteria bacterium]
MQGAPEGSPLYNHDLAPTTLDRRKWTTYNYAALWISMAHCIPTYMLASGLIASGMSWGQAIFTILLGNLIVLIPILLNSHPGTKYGIPFPVFARASYGVYGANLPALMRALVACGWFGIQTWIGGMGIHTLLVTLVPGWDKWGGHFMGQSAGAWVAFLACWALHMAIIFYGMEVVRVFENWAAPAVLVMALVLLVWIVQEAKGLGPILAKPSKFQSMAEFWPVFIPSLTAMIGFWSTLSLNMPDFTRFSKDQRAQVVGQAVALPTTMAIFAAMGVIITSAAAIVFPHLNPADAWDPVKLVGQFTQPLVVLLSIVTILVATVSVNIAANVVSPANDFSNAFPRYIDFRTGGLITGVVGILIMPWKLLENAVTYFGFLVTYSGGLGSIAAVMVVDYWIVRRTRLALADLYVPDGRYAYNAGWNWRAVAATALGCLAAWIGIWVPALAWLKDFGWFVGAFVAGLAYWLLMPRSAEAPSPATAI